MCCLVCITGSLASCFLIAGSCPLLWVGYLGESWFLGLLVVFSLFVVVEVVYSLGVASLLVPVAHQGLGFVLARVV